MLFFFSLLFRWSASDCYHQGRHTSCFWRCSWWRSHQTWASRPRREANWWGFIQPAASSSDCYSQNGSKEGRSKSRIRRGWWIQNDYEAQTKHYQPSVCKSRSCCTFNLFWCNEMIIVFFFSCFQRWILLSVGCVAGEMTMRNSCSATAVMKTITRIVSYRRSPILQKASGDAQSVSLK